MGKRNKNLDSLGEIASRIINEHPLPLKCHDHPLRGKHNGKRECHIEPDWLLIYKINTVKKTVVFDRTGTHADLFGV